MKLASSLLKREPGWTEAPNTVSGGYMDICVLSLSISVWVTGHKWPFIGWAHISLDQSQAGHIGFTYHYYAQGPCSSGRSEADL